METKDYSVVADSWLAEIRQVGIWDVVDWNLRLKARVLSLASTFEVGFIKN